MRRSKAKTARLALLFTALLLPLLVWTMDSSATGALTADKPATAAPAAEKVAGRQMGLPPSLAAALIAPPNNPAGDLDQVRNGKVGCADTVPNSCDSPADWVNGNAGASNSHYNEGQSIAYRMRLTSLPAGANSVFIEYDVKHSGRFAIDYITHYQRVAETILPCGSPTNHPEDVIAGCDPAAPSTFDIPVPVAFGGAALNPPLANPPQPQNSFNALPAAQRKFTVYNGTITAMTYVPPPADQSAAQSATRVRIDFTAEANKTVVMSWGGHIATRGDWGNDANGVPRSAGGISGSPYHTRLISLCPGGALTANASNCSGGNQDRSLSANAVTAPQGCTLTNDNLDVCNSPTTTTHKLGTAVDPNVTYSWSIANTGNSDAFISFQVTNPASPDPDGIHAKVTTRAVQGTNGEGTYTVTLTTSNAGGSQTCSATVRVHQPPAANAGAASYEHCETDGFGFAMSDAAATVPPSGTLKWTIDAANSTTTAIISNDTALNPTITLNGVGTVRAVLTVTGHTSCAAASDFADLTVSQAASVSAGGDKDSCASSPAVTLGGSFGGAATGATWSGGAGTFNPNANTPNATYTPSAGEIAAGSVELTLTTNDPPGSCAALLDKMVVTIHPNPVVEVSLVDGCDGIPGADVPNDVAHLHATVTSGTGPFSYAWTKNGAPVGTNSADLPLSGGPGVYAVSVTDTATNSLSCGGTGSIEICYAVKQVPAPNTLQQQAPNSLQKQVLPKRRAEATSGTVTFIARLARMAFGPIGLSLL